MDYFDACLLGLVQGLTEFLPVSSSGHLVIFQEWLNVDQTANTTLFFDASSHLATLLATCLYFKHSITRALQRKDHLWRLVKLASVSTIVTAVIGLSFKDQIENAFTNIPLVACAFILTGCLLFLAQRGQWTKRSLRSFGPVSAAVIGLAQACAITPGISRSGSTIAMSLLLGMRKRWAAEYSFLIAGPVIVGVTILKFVELLNDHNREAMTAQLPPIVLGSCVAGVVGYCALAMLVHVLRRSQLHYFSYYLWLLGITLLATSPFS